MSRHQPGHGIYIDLDGSTLTSGTMQSKTNFDLPAGTYLLQFDLGGSYPAGTSPPTGGVAPLTSNSVEIRLGNALDTHVVKYPGEPLTTYLYVVKVDSPTFGFLSFKQEGQSDYFGALLDNVSLTRVD